MSCRFGRCAFWSSCDHIVATAGFDTQAQANAELTCRGRLQHRVNARNQHAGPGQVRSAWFGVLHSRYTPTPRSSCTNRRLTPRLTRVESPALLDQGRPMHKREQPLRLEGGKLDEPSNSDNTRIDQDIGKAFGKARNLVLTVEEVRVVHVSSLEFSDPLLYRCSLHASSTPGDCPAGTGGISKRGLPLVSYSLARRSALVRITFRLSGRLRARPLQPAVRPRVS